MSVSYKSVVALTVLALSVTQANAFWRLECEGSTGIARLDPLMSFGGIGDHVHSIKGGSGKHSVYCTRPIQAVLSDNADKSRYTAFSSTSTGSDLLNSNCTSCGVAEDLSAYWTPAMYFMHNDGTVEVVPEKPPHKS